MKKTTPILFTITFLILLALPQIVTYAQQSAPVVEGLIAYIGEDHNVWILHGDSAESVRVTTDATDTDQYLLPRFSPDGSMLSYCKLIDKNPDKAMLFVSRVGEWQPILIADKVHCYDWPSLSYDWSPDSTKIIYTYPFTSNDEGGRGTEQWSSYRGIWLAEINNGAVSEIIPPPGKNPLINPQWSPDGDWIKLYEYSFTGSRGNLLTGHNDTGTLYTWFGGSSVWPGTSDWSPNSTQIVFDEIAFTGFRGAGIYIASPNGENITKIYSNPNQMARYPIWSPDGKTIAFQSTIVNQNPVLILVNSDGSEPLPIYTGHKRILPLAWSPSGRKLLFSTYVEDQIMMFVYDLDSRDTRQLGAAGAWSIDWNIGLIASEQTQETTVIPDFPYSDSLMVYVAPDRRLVLYDPQDGSELDLTEPLAVTSFYASPSGHKLVSGRRMISLEFEENDELHIIESVLPAAPIGEEINWAQDENQLAFMDWRDNVWIADSAGGGEQIQGAATLPDWSADGGWISYCAQDDVLFVLGENGSPIEIARNSDCETLWSPSKNLMAYNTLISSRAESSQAYVYDVNRGQSTHILENAGGISWSPDGKYLALKSVNIQTDVGSEYQVYASSPDGKKILELGEISDQTPGLSEWIITDTDYLFGPFAIAADLSSATRIADGILSYSKNSGLFLASNEELQFDILSCIDSTTGQQVRLLTVDRTDIPTNFLPGIWGWMSPDGKSAITRTYYDGAFVNLRHECEDAAQSNLPFGDFPDTGTYSDDGQFFYVNKINNGQQSYIQVYNLETSELERIPVATHYGAGWI
ncbi:MAG: hypothetical protein U9R58_03620, partial [Chloroflexota bacterium]|nr:hypothetical protein [Chloroflexota bacterium]